MTHHHHAPTLHRARASWYLDSRLSDGGTFHRNGRWVALPGRHLGERVRVYLPGGGSEVLPVRDVCGTGGRIDFPKATYRSIFGRRAIRRGLVPVRWQFVGRRTPAHGRRRR